MRSTTLRKWLLICAGLVSVVVGVIGIFIPVLPTTPLLLLAAACFIRSSDRLYRWLINHKWFGPFIRNYRAYKAITLRMKIVIIFLLWGTIGHTAFVVINAWYLRLILLLVAAGVTVHVLSMKTLTKEMLSEHSNLECEKERTRC
jgi:hypothetical protein